MKLKKVRSVNTTASRQTVYNRGMKRRSKLAEDILNLLGRQPNLTSAQIATELKAKPHSLKAVLWKLVNRQNKVVADRSANNLGKGPKIINVYCLAPSHQGQ